MAFKRPSTIATAPPTSDRAPPVVLAPDSPASSNPERGRLRKSGPGHARSASANIAAAPVDQSQPSLQEIQQGFAHRNNGGAPSPLLPPPTIGGAPYARSSSAGSRPGTPSQYSRPTTPTLNVPGQSPSTPTTAAKEQKKRKSWFIGKKDKEEDRGPMAWVAGHPQRMAYDASTLVNGLPMQEMWDDADGNCFVYLFPRNSGKGPSLKVDSAIFASSPVLTKLAFGDLYSNNAIQSGGDRRQQMPLDARTQELSLNDPNTPPATPKRNAGQLDTMSSTSSRESRGHMSNLSSDGSSSEAHLYIPIKMRGDGSIPLQAPPPRAKDGSGGRDPAMEDLQTLIDIRNFFAFLCGQSLIATERKSSFFHIFMTIAGILKAYEFSNLDGSTYGETASVSFDAYVEEVGLADVRSSREKTIEGIVLGERMKSVFLYNEAFTHAAGKHDELMKLNSPKFELISSVTKNRLIRAAMDLDKRTASVRLILTHFDFAALFTGIMASRVSDERKEGVRFDAWKGAFLDFRKNLLGMYKSRYGAWPPKASSKKNDLETSGLNRLVLLDMYNDLSSLYDLLVDRNHLTTRTVDGIALDSGVKEEPTVRALRAVLSEYDRSSPPVKPPVPFDLPKLPSLRSTRPDFGTDKKKDIKAIQKKLKDDEIAQILRRSWNDDAYVTPFVDMFREMEKKAAHGCTIAELVDLRIGQWIFAYVVLQALPMLACDAPGLKWTKGVEYFLCEPPRGGVPWSNPNAAGAGLANAGGGRTWFSVGEGGGVVSLPSDLVEHGVEGVYRRSHCWVMAEQWTRENPIMNEALHEQEAMNTTAGAYNNNNYAPPPTFDLPAPTSSSSLLAPDNRPSSRTSKRLSSLGHGLEALPLPVGVTPDGSAPSGYSPAPPLGYSSPGYGSPAGSRPGTPSRDRPKSAHVVDSSKTFESILANVGQDGKKKKR
ncbi:hypothetical protein LTR37_000335 [Vermiconidia calcicola]|uniref:Uncharacterized protein n=1 Tax=Vermiconidia calcicola TaxID=1690605 RepID=A0ACC3NZK3_9PEZI|nr:hypothetical protein LTR37_000335 [Vermiconidia calcicola]